MSVINEEEAETESKVLSSSYDESSISYRQILADEKIDLHNDILLQDFQEKPRYFNLACDQDVD
jgi:hypothetical protein